MVLAKLKKCFSTIAFAISWVHKRRHAYRIGCTVIGFLLILIFSLSLPVSTVTKDNSYAHVLGITLCMAFLWITNAVHSAIVALIPVYMYPLLGVESGSNVSRSYIDSVSMTFIGGFILALTLERWNLQKRIALFFITNVLYYEPFESPVNKSKYRIIRFFKFALYKFYSIPNVHRIPLIYLSFVTISFVLSAILSNTACALIMVPNAISVIQRLESALVAEDRTRAISEEEEKKKRAALAPLSTALLIGIAYSCGNGGLTTLIGTPTNLLFARQMETLKQPVTFFQWLLVGIPIGCAVQLFQTILLFVIFVVPAWYRIVKLLKEINCKKDALQEMSIISVAVPSSLHGTHEHQLADKLADQISNDTDATSPVKASIEVTLEPPSPTLTPVSPPAAAVANTTLTVPSLDISTGNMKKSESQDLMLPKSSQLLEEPTSARNSIDSTRTSIDNSERAILPAQIQENHNNIDISVFQREYELMGRLSFEEFMAIVAFAVTIIFWTTRSLDLGSFKGWDVLFKKGYVGEGTVAILFASLLFIIPAYHSPPESHKFEPSSASISHATLMDWKIMNKFPWDMLLLFGGGFALADGFTKSGLNLIIASWFDFLNTWSSFGIIAIVSLVVVVMTTIITSNTATIQIFLPILSGLATNLNINPALLLAPATFCCSYAYLLPVSTPPNAIAYTYSEGRLTVANMIPVGAVMALAGYAITVVVCFFLVPVVFPYVPTQ